jgi:hypothetical protein
MNEPGPLKGTLLESLDRRSASVNYRPKFALQLTFCVVDLGFREHGGSRAVKCLPQVKPALKSHTSAVELL